MNKKIKKNEKYYKVNLVKIIDLERELLYRELRNKLWKELSNLSLKVKDEEEYFKILYSLLAEILRPARFHYYFLNNATTFVNKIKYSCYFEKIKTNLLKFNVSKKIKNLLLKREYIIVDKNNFNIFRKVTSNKYVEKIKDYIKKNKSTFFLIFPFVLQDKLEGIFVLEWTSRNIEIKKSDIYNSVELIKIFSTAINNYRIHMELKKSEETALALLNSKNDWAVLIDAKGHIIAANDIVAQRLGVEKEKLIGQDIFKFFPSELVRSRKKIAELMMNLKQPISFEEVHEVNTYYITVSPVLDSNNHIVRLAIHAHDITDYKKAVELVFDNEEKFRALIENSNDGILIVDEFGTMKFVGHSITQIMGYTVNEVLGRSIYEYICKEDIPYVSSEMYKAYLDPSYKKNIEFKGIHKYKGIRYLEGIASNLLEHPAVRGFVINFRDITERKLAELDLNRYKHIVSSSSDHMLFIDSEYKILAVNDSFLRDFNKKIDEVRGKKLFEIFGLNEFNNFLKDRCEMVKLGGEAKVTHWLMIPRLGKRLVEISFYPYSENNKITGIVINLRDNTEKYNMEKELIEIQENEQKRIAMELHDGLNHSLLNIAILSKILGNELEKEGNVLFAKKAFELEKIANKCIEESRSIAKGLFPIQFERKSLKEVIENAIEGLKERSSINVIFDYSEKLPDFINLKVLSNIYYIINEALINISKHSNAKNAEIKCYESNQKFYIEITDDGTSFKKKKTGGLGISLMQYRAKMIGGVVSINRDRINKKTRLKFYVDVSNLYV